MAASNVSIADFRELTPQQLKDHLDSNNFDKTITTKLEGNSLSLKYFMVFPCTLC